MDLNSSLPHDMSRGSLGMLIASAAMPPSNILPKRNRHPSVHFNLNATWAGEELVNFNDSLRDDDLYNLSSDTSLDPNEDEPDSPTSPPIFHQTQQNDQRSQMPIPQYNRSASYDMYAAHRPLSSSPYSGSALSSPSHQFYGMMSPQRNRHSPPQMFNFNPPHPHHPYQQQQYQQYPSSPRARFQPPVNLNQTMPVDIRGVAVPFVPIHPRVRHLSKSSSQKSRSRHNSFDEAVECAYCTSLGKDGSGHDKKHCHVLQTLLPCKLCGASGEDNHTASHCPYQQKVKLQLKPEFELKYRKRSNSA